MELILCYVDKVLLLDFSPIFGDHHQLWESVYDQTFRYTVS